MSIKIKGKAMFLSKTFVEGGETSGTVPVNLIFWKDFNSNNVLLTGVEVIHKSSHNDVQLDWGDGSVEENVVSGLMYSHTFA